MKSGRMKSWRVKKSHRRKLDEAVFEGDGSDAEGCRLSSFGGVPVTSSTNATPIASGDENGIDELIGSSQMEDIVARERGEVEASGEVTPVGDASLSASKPSTELIYAKTLEELKYSYDFPELSRGDDDIQSAMMVRFPFFSIVFLFSESLMSTLEYQLFLRVETSTSFGSNRK